MISISGAYGRKYKYKKEVVKDWEDGLDFKIVSGPYCSIRDEDSMLEEYGRIEILYGNRSQFSYFISKGE